jgi:predicted GNAT family N-acyltransferase
MLSLWRGYIIKAMIKPVFKVGLMDDAKAIRTAVFIKEQGYEHEFDQDEATCWNLVLYFNGTPISTGRLKEVDPETYQIQRIAVLPPYRHQKVGSYTVKFLITKARSLGARKVILGAQLDKIPFYKQLGFRPFPEGEVYFDEGHPHQMMYKVIVTKNKPQRISY